MIKRLVRWKIYMDRARMYLSYINFLMIAFVFLDAIDRPSWRTFLDSNKVLIYPAVMVAFIGFSLVLGYFDTKLGLRKEELRNNSIENPVLYEILKLLKDDQATTKGPKNQ